jgi:hypothetical protein
MKTQRFEFPQGSLLTMSAALLDDPEFDAMAREIVSLAVEADKAKDPRRSESGGVRLSAYPLPKGAARVGWHMQRGGRMIAVGHVEVRKEQP